METRRCASGGGNGGGDGPGEDAANKTTWHDNMLQLNRELVLHSMKVTSEVETLTSTNDVLVKKLDSIQKNMKELEEVRSVKRQLLQKQRETNALLKDQILQLDEFLSLKKAQLHQLKSTNLKELEEDAKNRRTAEDIYRTWKRNVEQVAHVFEYAPRAQVRTALKQELELQQERLAALQQDIETERRRQRERRALEQVQQQQSIVRLARLMLNYHRMGDVVAEVARATAALEQREHELQDAPKSDNIFSEGVKQIDSLMRAHDLQVSPLKSLHVGFNSDDDDDDDDDEAAVVVAAAAVREVNSDAALHLDLMDLTMKRPLSPLLLPPSKKLCTEEDEQVVVVTEEASVFAPPQPNNNLNVAPKPSPVKLHNTGSTLDNYNLNVAPKPSPIKQVDANVQKAQLTSRQLEPVRPKSVTAGPSLTTNRQDAAQPSKLVRNPKEKPEKTPVHVAPVHVATPVPRTQFTLYSGGGGADTRSMYFQSGSGRDLSQQPSSIETLQTIDNEEMEGEEDTTQRSSSEPSFSPGSAVRTDSSMETRPLHTFDMFGVRDAPITFGARDAPLSFGARDAPTPFSITFGEPRNTSQPRFNIF